MINSQHRRVSGEQFPCATLDEALPHLRRPPTAAAVRFKIQNTSDRAAQIAAYVDARLVFDRLDHVCGAKWAAEFDELPEPLRPGAADRNGEPLPHIHVRCRLTLYGVTRQDVGAGDDPKAAFSDAIKRAAVHFGIARSLYAMRLPWLSEGAGDSELRRNRKGRLILDGRTERWCRDQYGRWLDERGAAQFGPALDHGDDPGAPGFEAEGSVAANGSQTGNEESAVHAGSGAGGIAAERAPAQTGGGGMRAVTNGDAGTPPATAIDRQRLVQSKRAGRYDDNAVRQLAQVVCGERVIERLTAEQVKDVALLLDMAVQGRVAQRTLTAKLDRLAREQTDEPGKALRAFLGRKADEVGLLGRREAA